MITAPISMRGVGRMFGATVALAGVDLDLEPGVTGLLGPNGAGKTTLIRLLATALPPTGGEIRVLGRDPQVPAQRTGIRRRLGYLPQEVGFPRGFTASAFIDYIALLKEWAAPAARHAEVRRVLDLVGLSDLATKRIRAMSGGQRRRVALAPGAARLAAGADPGRADHRRRSGAAGDAADRAGGDRAYLGRGAVHPPDRGHRGPVRTRDRAGPRPGPLRRPGH
ncbi:MAG TPA: ATP-binding cassette domain-containing protein, partial [Streptosporangiaceae bacterium]|nr:ATP-binding cassette domain-containing protein [Streptosporangiaceae bacterium]